MAENITIFNTVYDISSYMKRHPGGETIMKFWVNKDATMPFMEFHSNIGYVSRILKSLPVVNKLIIRDEKQHDDFSTFLSFRNFLKKNGYYRHSKIHAFKRISELLILFGLGSFLLKYAKSLFL